MKAQHTPTPWHIEEMDGDDQLRLFILTDKQKDSFVAECRSFPEGEGKYLTKSRMQTQANAAYIVHCVNNFDNLLEIVTRCAQSFLVLEEEHPRMMKRPVRQRLIADIHAALKAVQKGAE